MPRTSKFWAGTLPCGRQSPDVHAQASREERFPSWLDLVVNDVHRLGTLPWWLAAPCLSVYPGGPVYINRRGTSGVASVAYWWSRFAAALLRANRRVLANRFLRWVRLSKLLARLSVVLVVRSWLRDRFRVRVGIPFMPGWSLALAPGFRLGRPVVASRSLSRSGSHPVWPGWNWTPLGGRLAPRRMAFGLHWASGLPRRTGLAI